MPTPEAACVSLPLKGAEPGRDGSSGPVTPGQEHGCKAWRGLQGTPADRQSRIRGVRLAGSAVGRAGRGMT